MASFQRVALFILFDALEHDLVTYVREAVGDDTFLNDREREKARRRVATLDGRGLDPNSDFDLVYGLDLGEKYALVLRTKDRLSEQLRDYFSGLQGSFERIVKVRNDVMHGRPLTIDQQVVALAFAQSLLRSSSYWPTLRHTYTEYTNNPGAFLNRSVVFLDEGASAEALNNLPVPDHDATGFLSRPTLEKDLKKRILGRNPVVTVLGEGGNGKTALALQVLHDLVRSNDHNFDAIIWTTAKTSDLTATGIVELNRATVAATELMKDALILDPDIGEPEERLRKFLEENKVLLVIDNYETVVGSEITRLAQDVPGESKLLFTSRHPIGGDITVTVGEMTPKEAMTYYRRLVDVHSVSSLKKINEGTISGWLKKVSYKPLLIKWLVLGVKSGLNANNITQNIDIALRYCLDNVILNLGKEAQAVIVVLAVLPSSVPPSVIQAVSNLTANQINDGLAELNRFGLIDSKVHADGSQSFFVRQFSRSYIQRLIKPAPAVSESIIRNYQKVESSFQEERLIKGGKRYHPNNMVVRSRSELIVANLLRRAMGFAESGRFEEADDRLAEAKSLEPTYFEIHRCEAYIALTQNDWSRAIEAFKNAISLDTEQPQLYTGLAGTLMRLLENNEAAEYFDKAIELDADSYTLREAARNQYMMANFDSAQGYLDRAFDAAGPYHYERMKLFDVQLQLFTRKAEYKLKQDLLDEALCAVDEFAAYLESIDPTAIDERLVFHALKVEPTIVALERALSKRPLETLRARQSLAKITSVGVGLEFELSLPGNHLGILKHEGRRADYGFLQSESIEDAFIHITRVPAEIWDWMLADGPVYFDVDQDDYGRPFAFNVSRAE